ncbi:hybrid sensor histidine kinase/response regulator [Thauera linaloolentis]|uniref:histidine kinase n=1 Tax=Thauera linaloolentis (strain DSM 12138 / JCM 21573 / CCUG 41526 / CIP 105981 / IAM 15112 / NBRC 102519 / 47Lol) TaxID=1123367 RepID=N6Y8M7_THAL4|nr:ATP-binding protein [Thauera linaloolentis]ENO90671.1 complex two-component hybrid sensor protein [Thauera linaloolentis 47Lol = DSM 12138]MCM8565579.1 ATP-binding protein [Thauera linaloolentis]
MISGWGIRARVMLAAVLPMLVLAAIMTTVFTGLRLSDLDEALSARGRAFARQLAAASEQAVFAGNTGALHQVASSATGEDDVLAVRILDRDGQLLAASRRPGGPPPAPLPGPASMLPLASSATLLHDGTMLRLVEPIRPMPIEIDDGFPLVSSGTARIDPPHPQGAVVLDLSLERLSQRRAQLLLAGIGSMLVVLFGSLLLAARLSRGVSGPIRAVADVVLRIGHGKLHERAEQRGGGSLQRLAQGVNEMAERLEHAHDHMRRQIDEATAELRARTAEAEHANASKSHFLAAASHDLRQPMHALGLFISELSQQALDARSRQIVDRIAASADAMEQLLDSLLDISRLDAGVLVPAIRSFDPVPILERIRDEQMPAAHGRGIRLRLRTIPAHVRSDPMLFERIVGNLVGNAVRHTRDGSILVACRSRGDTLRVEVRDNGPGIPAESQQAIFQEFVQLGNPERARDKGLGLGLAIVRRLVVLLGHRLELRSAPGRGSVFALELPLSAAEAEAATTEDARALGSLNGIRVAVVEDDPLVRDAMLGLLASWGCELIVANDAEHLLEQLEDETEPPEVLITDLRLGGRLDGIDLALRLRRPPGRPPHTVLISGDTAPEALARARAAGLPLLHKPLRPAKLRALMHRMLGGA